MQLRAADVDSTKGSAFPAVDEYIAFLSKDTVKNKNKIIGQYYYMATIAADKLKDYPKAIAILERLQAVDPENAFANNALPILRKASQQASTIKQEQQLLLINKPLAQHRLKK